MLRISRIRMQHDRAPPKQTPFAGLPQDGSRPLRNMRLVTEASHAGSRARAMPDWVTCVRLSACFHADARISSGRTRHGRIDGSSGILALRQSPASGSYHLRRILPSLGPQRGQVLYCGRA